MSREAVVTRIHKIIPHEGADRLEIAILFGDLGFHCIVGKDNHKPGDLVLYIEPETVLSDEIDAWLKANSKISIKNKRLRAAKIRGVISEGLILRPEDFLSTAAIKEDADVSSLIGVVHYEPPEPRSGYTYSNRCRSNMWYKNENFLKFFHIDRIQKYPNVFQIGEPVIATCKRHGQNIRFFYGRKSEKQRRSLWHRFKKFLHLTTDYEFLVGSHNTVRNPNYTKKDAQLDHFLAAAEKYKMKELMPRISKFLAGVGGNKDLILYGEVIGYGPTGEPLQIGYNYGLPKGELDVVFYDICVGGEFFSWSYVKSVCQEFDLPIVETIYEGPFDKSVLDLAEAVDEYNGQKYNREGIVIKPLVMRKDPRIGWAELKQINSKYLIDKTNTEHH